MMETPELRPAAPLVAAVLTAAVLWLGRDVQVLDVLVSLSLPVIWLALWSLACVGVGGFLLRWLQVESDSQLVLVLATGAALLSTTATLLAAVHLLTALVLRLVLFGAAAAGVVGLLKGHVRLTYPRLGSDRIGIVLVAGAWGLLGLLLTAPPVMFDALHYHLAFPARWLEAGGFVEFARHGFSYYPSGHGMAYVFALATVGPWGASALHWWFGALAGLAAGALGFRLAGARAGWWALFLFALTPATLQVAGIAVADLVVAAWGGAAMLVILGEVPSKRRWALAGGLTGAAVAAKYLALASVALPIGVASLLITGWRSKGKYQTLILVLAAVAVSAPWFIRNAVWTGNPLYPYFESLVGAPASTMSVATDMSQNDLPAAGPVGVVLRALTAVPVRTFKPLRQAGLLGLFWVLLLPLSLLLRRLDRRLVIPLAVAVVVGAVAWGGLVHFARFLLPTLVLAAPLAGAVAASLVSLPSVVIRRTFSVLFLILAAWNATIVATEINLQRLGRSIGKISDADFLSSWVSYAPLLELVNHELPENATLLLVAEPRSLYLQRKVLVEDSYRRPWLLDLAEGCATTADLADRLRELGVTHVLVDEGLFDRSAKLRGVHDYWEGGSHGAREVCVAFLDHGVERISPAGSLWLGRVR